MGLFWFLSISLSAYSMCTGSESLISCTSFTCLQHLPLPHFIYTKTEMNWSDDRASVRCVVVFRLRSIFCFHRCNQMTRTSALQLMISAITFSLLIISVSVEVSSSASSSTKDIALPFAKLFQRRLRVALPCSPLNVTLDQRLIFLVSDLWWLPRRVTAPQATELSASDWIKLDSPYIIRIISGHW